MQSGKSVWRRPPRDALGRGRVHDGWLFCFRPPVLGRCLLSTHGVFLCPKGNETHFDLPRPSWWCMAVPTPTANLRGVYWWGPLGIGHMRLR